MNGETEKSKSVTRFDLAAIVNKLSNGSREESAAIVDAVFEEITNALVAGHPVKLNGFASFIPHSKSERIGRNPKTGELHVIAPRTVIRFKPSFTLRARVSGK